MNAGMSVSGASDDDGAIFGVSGRPDVDLSCCLLFQGDHQDSAGLYLPTSYRLSLRGGDVKQHHVMHLHEIHHKVLNDDTAWGSFIHVVARHPGWSGQLLPDLVDSARLVHESFASFMSLSLARTRHADAERVLDLYPLYAHWGGRMGRLLEHVPQGHRQDLAATGVARWCMSAPVFDAATSVYPRRVRLSDIPSRWRPDQRFRAFLSVSPDVIHSASEYADSRFRARYGQLVADLSLSDTDERLDRAWTDWEDLFIEQVVASQPRLQRMPTVAANSHLDSAAELIAALVADGVEISLPHDRNGGSLSDVESVQRLTMATTVLLHDPPLRADLAIVGEAVELYDVLDLCASWPKPYVIVHGRPTTVLAQSFRFGPADLAHLAELAPGPLFAVRLLVDDGDGGDVILHAGLRTPHSYRRLVAQWAGRGVLANCLTASCFLSLEWQTLWQPALRSQPTVVLLDVGLLGSESLLGTTERVYGQYLDLSTPSLTSLVWHVEGHPHVMLAVGDDLTIQLIAGQLTDLLEDRLSMSDSNWSQWLDVLSAVTSSILATDATLHFRGDLL